MALHWRHNDHDGVSNHQPHGCLLNRLFRYRSKKTSKLRVTGLCAGNSPVPVNSPHTQRASNAENVFIWWRHHGQISMDSCDMFTHIRHHTEVTWPSWRLKSPTTRFLISSLFRPTSEKTPSKLRISGPLCGNPSVNGGSITKGQQCGKPVDTMTLHRQRTFKVIPCNIKFPQLHQSFPTMHHPLSSATHTSTIIREFMIDGIHLIDLCLFVCNIWYSFCAIGGAHPMHPMKFLPNFVVFLWLYG